MNRVVPELVRGWIGQGAIEWRCRRCPRILGYVLGRDFCSYHAHRGTRIPLGGTALQICDRCGHENVYDPARGLFLDA